MKWGDLTGHGLSFRFEQVYPASLKAANLWFVRWCASLDSVLFVMKYRQSSNIILRKCISCVQCVSRGAKNVLVMERE